MPWQDLRASCWASARTASGHPGMKRRVRDENLVQGMGNWSAYKKVEGVFYGLEGTARMHRTPAQKVSGTQPPAPSAVACILPELTACAGILRRNA